jgi:hypothetical protein
MARILDFADGFSSAAEPTAGAILANGHKVFVDDAAFVTDKGSAATDGDVYLNSTLNAERSFINSEWRTTSIIKATKAAIDALSREAGRQYFSTDGLMYFGDDGTSVIDLSGSGGGGGSFAWLVSGGGPGESDISGLEVYDFDFNASQSIFATFKVPNSYTPGNQIKISDATHSCTAITGNVLYRTVTTLLQDGSDAIDDSTDQHTSTNTELTVPGTTKVIQEVGDIDLTDGSGEINLVAVAAGDVLLIELKRDVGNETTSAAADSRLMKNSMKVVTS